MGFCKGHNMRKKQSKFPNASAPQRHKHCPGLISLHYCTGTDSSTSRREPHFMLSVSSQRKQINADVIPFPAMYIVPRVRSRRQSTISRWPWKWRLISIGSAGWLEYIAPWSCCLLPKNAWMKRTLMLNSSSHMQPITMICTTWLARCCCGLSFGVHNAGLRRRGLRCCMPPICLRSLGPGDMWRAPGCSYRRLTVTRTSKQFNDPS